MAITITNQKPAILPHDYQDDISQPFDPYNLILNDIVGPLRQPATPGTDVTVSCDGTPMSDTDITNLFIECSQDGIDPQAEDMMRELLQAMLSWSIPAYHTFQNVYALQAARQNGMIIPDPHIVYTAQDIVDEARHLLSGQLSRDAFGATYTFASKISSYGYYFVSNDEWKTFINWMEADLRAKGRIVPLSTLEAVRTLRKTSLHCLSQSYVLRDEDWQNQEPYSFARVFPKYLTMYEKKIDSEGKPASTAGRMLLSFGENICPRTVVIINLERHAHANPVEVARDCEIIRNALYHKPKVLNLNKIQSLTAVERMAQKMALGSGARWCDDLCKAAELRFAPTAPSSEDMYKYIEKIYRHAAHVQQSENAIRCRKKTYQKPSRREPDNPDRMGTTLSWQYKPDLHVYLDSSASISEDNYQDGIKSCIALAKKMNVNIYFTSFSHVMSQPAKLRLKDKTGMQIYNEFRKIPKVTGGTDYEQIWHCINKSKVRSEQVSLIITDMEYTAPQHFVKHPRHLYYVPIANSDWKRLTKAATTFAQSMMSIDPYIRKRLLM